MYTCKPEGGLVSAQMGFFAEAGPVQVFVSNHLIPDEFSFVAADEPSFVSADEAVRIVAGAEARLRIVGTRVDATEIVRACAAAPAQPCTCLEVDDACMPVVHVHVSGRCSTALTCIHAQDGLTAHWRLAT